MEYYTTNFIQILEETTLVSYYAHLCKGIAQLCKGDAQLCKGGADLCKVMQTYVR